MFSFPIGILYLFTLFLYSMDKGDLIRVGYVMDSGNYRSIFSEDFKQKYYYTQIAKANLDTPKKYTILTIGDSFTGQKGLGFKNYLAQNPNISVLHLDYFLCKNPIQTAYGIANGDLLNTINVNYIIVESVEREIINRSKNLNVNQKINIDSIKKLIKKYEKRNVDSTKINSFSANRMIKFPIRNISYLFDDNAFYSETYMVKTNKKLFTIDQNNLLFSIEDLKNLKGGNDAKAVSKLNDVFNDLSKRFSMRGIKLIVMPCADKLDFYYDNIVENKKYKKPLFFDYFDSLPKNYFYINSKKILRPYLKNKKDLYFYDDTHWSPISDKIIANELYKIINNKQ